MKKEKYISALKYYKRYSDKILKCVRWTIVLIVLWIIVDRALHLKTITTVPSFFLFIAFLLLSICAALHLNYRQLLKDPMSEISECTDNSEMDGEREQIKEEPAKTEEELYNKIKKGIATQAEKELYVQIEEERSKTEKELYEQIKKELAKTEEELANNIKKNRKRIYANTGLFWAGVICFAIAIISAFFPTCGEDNKRNSDDGKLELSLLQINDVYEIAALDGGRIGGMARIAALKKEFLKQNKNTMLLMAGDFLSPSVFNSVKKDGKGVYGKQMITAMNVAGVDLAIFGNHEFDLPYADLQQRINESSFQWVASNVLYDAKPGTGLFKKNTADIPKTWIKNFTDEDSTSISVGFFGLTTADNKGNPEYASIDSITLHAAKEAWETLKSCDAVIAITHQDLKDDELLARELPGLAAIIGGHEHDMQFEKIGNVYITKAHANAKSAFHLQVSFNKNSDPKVVVKPGLISIDSTIIPDFFTKNVCDKWMQTAVEFFRDSGFSPDKIMSDSFRPNLDGRDIAVRRKPTNLTRLITDAMLDAASTQKAEIAIMNAGSIRVDDIIGPPVNEYSFLRALPYGGAIRIASMKGYFIKALLDSAAKLRDQGDFLQYSDNLDKIRSTINNVPIDDSGSYVVAISDFLIKGNLKKLRYVKEGAPGIVSVNKPPEPKDSSMYDVRKAVIKYIEKNSRNRIIMARYN